MFTKKPITRTKSQQATDIAKGAISMVEVVVTNLDKSNKLAEEVIIENEQEIDRREEENAAMEANIAGNKVISKNFNALLGIEDEK